RTALQPVSQFVGAIFSCLTVQDFGNRVPVEYTLAVRRHAVDIPSLETDAGDLPLPEDVPVGHALPLQLVGHELEAALGDVRVVLLLVVGQRRVPSLYLHSFVTTVRHLHHVVDIAAAVR